MSKRVFEQIDDAERLNFREFPLNKKFELIIASLLKYRQLLRTLVDRTQEINTRHNITIPGNLLTEYENKTHFSGWIFKYESFLDSIKEFTPNNDILELINNWMNIETARRRIIKEKIKNLMGK